MHLASMGTYWSDHHQFSEFLDGFSPWRSYRHPSLPTDKFLAGSSINSITCGNGHGLNSFPDGSSGFPQRVYIKDCATILAKVLRHSWALAMNIKKLVSILEPHQGDWRNFRLEQNMLEHLFAHHWTASLWTPLTCWHIWEFTLTYLRIPSISKHLEG